MRSRIGASDKEMDKGMDKEEENVTLKASGFDWGSCFSVRDGF